MLVYLEVIDLSLKFGLLGFLSNQEMSGYDLEKMFNQSIGFFWNAKISQVYRDLRTMEKSGWVESNEVIQKGKPNKKVFKITDQGRQELDNWLISYNVKGDFEIRIGILMRMFFAEKRPKAETIALLEQFKTGCYEAIDRLKPVYKELEDCEETMEVLYIKSTLSYGEKYYNMQIEWSNETIEMLKNCDNEVEEINNENDCI